MSRTVTLGRGARWVMLQGIARDRALPFPLMAVEERWCDVSIFGERNHAR